MVFVKIMGRKNPMGIDNKRPDFSWVLTSEETGLMQTAYHIVVKKEDGTCVWDSEKVVSEASVEMAYDGAPLEAATRYLVDIQVTDNQGQVHVSENTFFETGLFLAGEKTLGDGAKWIGADELTLDAAAACYFDLRMDMTLAEGSYKAGVVFGANEFRLQNKNFNIWGKAEATNYVTYEIDVEGLIKGTSDTANLNIYVVGMPVLGQSVENPVNEVDFSVPIPTNALSKETAYDKISIAIDTISNVNQVSCTINGVMVDPKRQLNPLGNSHDYNTYPNLGEIGFALKAGEQVVYENIALYNPGPYSEGILFSDKIGATYEIFKALEGVNVGENGQIVVSSDKDLLVYSDPSYGSAPMLRTEFKAEQEIEKARLYVTAHGIYDMWINGEKISEDWFNPGNSQYRERIGYNTYDVKPLLKSNDLNALTVQLAEGWWSGYQTFIVDNYNYYGDQQALMAKLVITYADGSQKILVTDENQWSYYGQGPIEYGSFFQGERYNANKEIVGWKDAGFDASEWRKAVEVVTEDVFSDYTLMTRMDEPIRQVKTIQAQSVQKTSNHTDFAGNYAYIYDMGENILGVPEIEIPADLLVAGQKVILRYAEILYPSQLKEYQEAGIANMMMVENYRAAMSTDFYIAKNSEAVTLAPSKTFHGFRFIEISGLSEPLPIEQVKTKILTSIQLSATYESSNPLVNRFFKNVQNSQCSNFVSLPTDCPQRNERLGWTGDAQVFSMAASYNADVYNFYRQWLFTLRDDQYETGALPVFAPSFVPVYPDKAVLDANSFFCGVSWDAALVLIPYNLYLQYGRKEIIAENMTAIEKYLNYLMSHPMTVGDQVYEGLTSKAGILADWLGIEQTDHTLINNAVYAYLLETTAKMAKIIGDTVLADKYHKAYELSKAQWNALYVDETGHTISAEGVLQDTQASYATPLRYGIFNEVNAPKAAQYYQKTVTRTLTEKGNYTIKTGFSGTPNLVPTLSNYGYVEEAYKLFESTEYASWLYPVLNGATSIWERWNSYTVDGGFNGNNSMNSFNHFSLGAIYEWMMGYQLGIMHDENTPGYKNVILQPQMGGQMTYAKGTFESPYGQIKVGWTREAIEKDEQSEVTVLRQANLWQTYEVTLPANTTGDLYLPIVGELSVVPCLGVTVLQPESHHGVLTYHFKLQNGTYMFKWVDGKIVVL